MDDDSDALDSGCVIFRGRKMTNDTDIYSFNTWDDVVWDSEREIQVTAFINDQITASNLVSLQDSDRKSAVMEAAGCRWDWFYKHHSRWFFKDRKWLQAEFPELFTNSVKRVWEVGCGVGNTLFPLASYHKRTLGQQLYLHACDVSEEAIRLVKEFRDFDADSMDVFVYDANSGTLPASIHPNSIDIITCIFVLSALDPDKLQSLFQLFHTALKPGGHVLIRDYAWGDLAQTRLKPERLVTSDASLYTRGDGTAVHFFTGLEFESLAANTGFSIHQNYTDRRLIVNRKRKLEMWRCWIQVKLIKEK